MLPTLIPLLAALAAALIGPDGAAPARRAPRLGVAVRIDGAYGRFEEQTWAAPGVELRGSLGLGRRRRAFVELTAGYSPLDSHTFLSDGLLLRVGVAGGARLARQGRLRVAATAAVEHAAYHADPDVLEAHPGVSLTARRGGTVPTVGAFVAYDLGRLAAIGLSARTALRELELFREGDAVQGSTGGAVGRARLTLTSAFVELRFR